MSVTIESLELQIQSNSTSAVNGIDALSASLSKIKEATKGGIGLSSIANQVSNFAIALKTVNENGINNLDRLVNSLSKLSALGKITILSSVGKQIKNISYAISSLKGTDLVSIGNLSTALRPLGDIEKASGLQSTINQLKKIPELVKILNGVNWTTFADQIKRLTSSLTPLNKQLNIISPGLSTLSSNVKRTVNLTNELTTANKKITRSYVNMWAKFTMAIQVVRTSARVLASWIKLSNAYIENLNLFTASMGEYAQEAQNYAEKVGELMGIDPSEFIRNQGVFMTITEGFGVASDRAYIMSRNLTQLGYDLSSFFNISFADSMQKLTSGISGELEPLRRLGYDLSQTRLQAIALSLGIRKTFNEMNQAEKAQLRYYAIMTQVTVAHGDMARTLNAPANQLRIFRAQTIMAGRALGNIFIPMLNAVLPYAIAVTKVVRMLANAIANLAGFKLPEIDYSGVKKGSDVVADLAKNADGVGTGLGKARKNAKKLKDSLLGIDELNIISADNNENNLGGTGRGGAGIAGGDFGFDLPEYDFLAELVNAKVGQITDKIIGALREMEAAISFFSLALGTILVVTGVNIPIGLALMAAGAAGLVNAMGESWGKMSDRLAGELAAIEIALGVFFLTIGTILVLSGANIPLGLGLMAVGAASLATGLTINWKFVKNKLTGTLLSVEGALGGFFLAIGGLLAFTGVNIPLGVALIAVGATKLTAAASLNWKNMPDSMRKVISVLEMIISTALMTFGAVLMFTGANIPLGLALFLAGAVSLVTAVRLNWESLSKNLKKSISTIVALVSGALIGIGAVLAFTGVATVLGVAMIAAGAIGLISTTPLDWGALSKKIKSVLKEIGIAVGISVLALGAILAFSGVATVVGMALMASGAALLVTGIALNWEGISKKIKDVLKKIGATLGTSLLALGTMLCLSGVAIPLGMALIVVGAASIVSAIALNWDSVFEKIKTGLNKIKDFVLKIGKLSIGVMLCLTGVGIPIGMALIKDGISSLVSGAGLDENAIVKKIEKGLNRISDKFEEFKNRVRSKISDVKNALSGLASDTNGDFMSPRGRGAIGSLRGFAKGGFIEDNGKSGFWKSVPMYASGTVNAGLHGSLFVAGERGAEMVGHINGQTEVLNRSQIVMAMRSAVVAGMSQFTEYWRNLNNQIPACANAVIRSIMVSSEVLNAAIVENPSYESSNLLAQSVYSDSQGDCSDSQGIDNFTLSLKDFYREYVAPTLEEIAYETKKQADKEETTVVKLNSKTIRDAVMTQNKADGYNFVTT